MFNTSWSTVCRLKPAEILGDKEHLEEHSFIKSGYVHITTVTVTNSDIAHQKSLAFTDHWPS